MNKRIKFPSDRPIAPWRRRFLTLLALVLIIVLVPLIYLAARFLPDRPVTYANIEDHFKYGSTGGERESGFPYWIWRALPQVCASHLPDNGAPRSYEAFGLVYEPGKDLPIGVMQRRHLGIDRVFLNCAVCHHSTVRDKPDAEPRVYLGMPAARLDLMAFERFMFNCAADERFRAEYIVPEVERLAGGLNAFDRYVVYPVAIGLMRERLLMLKGRLNITLNGVEWGPGRVDTFNAAKILFNIPLDRLPEHELHGAADFPSVWNQRSRQGMQLHWDGNNTKVEERNKSAAFGTGTTPATLDIDAIGRLEEWMRDVKAPPYPYPINKDLAGRGAALYKQYCVSCHGANGQDFTGDKVGQVTPIAEIGTDRGRLDSYTYELAVNQGTLYAGYPWRFQNFRKTYGYTNMPLDGIWLRGPYLHNGSVPTLRDLLEVSWRRPRVFYRGNDLYDPIKVGFVSTLAEEKGRKYFRYDTSLPSNGNLGHEGKAYGTSLPPADKDAIVEYMKTF
ncbi:MAG: c-type cytochrome [Gammaproteobacteria bacterium]|nr:c-type cytochrome [Gammaproteobacteria bacterium]